MLNSTEHETYHAHNVKMPTNVDILTFKSMGLGFRDQSASVAAVGSKFTLTLQPLFYIPQDYKIDLLKLRINMILIW